MCFDRFAQLFAPVVLGAATGKANDERLFQLVPERLQSVEGMIIEEQLARPGAGDLGRREVQPAQGGPGTSRQ